MIELEENKKELLELKSKLESLGESLWHRYNNQKTRRIGKQDIKSGFLEW